MDDVLIVGAGPTGLVLALWLTAQGVRVRIIDKSAGPGTTSRAWRCRRARSSSTASSAWPSRSSSRPPIPPSISGRDGKRRGALALGDVGAGLTSLSFRPDLSAGPA